MVRAYPINPKTLKCLIYSKDLKQTNSIAYPINPKTLKYLIYSKELKQTNSMWQQPGSYWNTFQISNEKLD